MVSYFFLLHFLSGPELPDLPDVFQTRVEVTINGKMNLIREIYYDFGKRQAAYKDQVGNIESLYVYDYKQNEIHLITSK